MAALEVKGKAGRQQEAATYRFYEETLRQLNLSSGFGGDVRMNPAYLESAIAWVRRNAQRNGDGSWGVEAALLQPGNRKDKNSLYNYARKLYPKGGAEDFCKDILGMIREADALRKESQRQKQRKENGFIKST